MHISDIFIIINEITSSVEGYVTKSEEHLGVSETKDEKEDSVIFNANLKKYAVDLYRHLNLSVLEAEYITCDSFKDDLSGIIKMLESSSESFSESMDFLQEAQLFYRYVSYIKNDISSYINQINLYERSINEPQKFLIEYEPNINTFYKENSALGLSIYSKAFLLNLDLMLYDRELSLRNYSFYAINKLSCEFESLKIIIQEPYIDALLHKCKILKAKFYYKDEIGGLLDAYNFYNNQFEDIDLRVDEIGYVSKKMREINTRDRKKYEQNIISFFHGIDSPKTSFEYFVTCHYYKNIALDEISLTKLIQDYSKSIENDDVSISHEDIHRRKVNLSYLRNCLFSYQLKNKELEPDCVEHLFEEAKSVQNQTGIGNHFCYYKTAVWYRDYLDKCINEKKIECNLRKFLNRFNDNIIRAENILYERSRDATSFIPFMPEIDECYEEYKSGLADDTIKIFISTSYVVPVDYSKARKQVEDLKADYIRQRSVIEASLVMNDGLKNVTNMKEETQKVIQEQELKTKTTLDSLDLNFKAELSDNLKNSIQILSIFSAIVLFASGTIQIFTGATSIKDASIFMIMFAAALGLVALFVRNCFVSRNGWAIRDWTYLAALITVIGLTALGVFADWGTESTCFSKKANDVSEQTLDISLKEGIEMNDMTDTDSLNNQYLQDTSKNK